ncbi:DUF2255 family protein [Pedobacter sp. N36a]|nr:DUF2255 family protein [Pedobacter sp. N36a]
MTDSIHQIAAADDFHIAPFREDGKTFGTPTSIWSLRVGNDLFVRGYNGTDSRWYQSAVKQKGGKIESIGKTFQVDFEPISGKINDAIDEAYREKYKVSPYLPPMVSERTRAATVKVILKNEGANIGLNY